VVLASVRSDDCKSFLPSVFSSFYPSFRTSVGTAHFISGSVLDMKQLNEGAGKRRSSKTTLTSPENFYFYTHMRLLIESNLPYFFKILKLILTVHESDFILDLIAF
jgi:hypothetical protein